MAQCASNIQIKIMTNSVLSSISLLGFDIRTAQEQHKILLNSTTFVKPNLKVIIHFLFCQLDFERAQRSFHQCWPQLLKEQAKEFKEIIYAWLTELVSSKQQQSFKNNSLLHYIEFPNIQKSLLVSPVIVCKINKIKFKVDANELNVRIWPKVSPLQNNTPFSNITNDVRTNQLRSQSTSVKLLNAKQLNHFEIQKNAYLNKIDNEMKELIKNAKKMIDLRNKWLQFSDERVKSIKELITKKANLTQLINKDLKKLNDSCKIECKPDECTLDELCDHILENKLATFITKFDTLLEIKKNSVDNKIMKTEDKQACKQTELNGHDFIFGKANEKFDENNLSQNLLSYLIEQNTSYKDTKIDELYHENENKLNMVSLIRLYNLSLIKTGDYINKVNTNNFFQISSTFNQSNLSNLSEDEQLYDLMLENCTMVKAEVINEKSLELKKQVALICSKYMEKNHQISRELLHEPNKENGISVNSFKMIDNYFGFRKRSMLDENKLTILREKSYQTQQNCWELNKQQLSSNDSLQVLDLSGVELGHD